MTTTPPLDGIKVLDFSELLPGPFFTQSLADLGASVIKVERPPHGDNARLLGAGGFEAVNRGKRSLLVNLKQEDAREELYALADEADILVETYRPGVMARLGMDAETVRARNPRLIYVSLTGYGQDGPWAHWPGHDINYLAAAGALALTGTDEDWPASNLGLPVADLCGSSSALSATLAALYQRRATGEGQYLDVSITDSVLHWMTARIGAFRSDGKSDLAAQRAVTVTKPAYGAFACRDGRHVTIAALEDHFWMRLVEAIDMGPFASADYARMPARKAAAEAINRQIASACRDRDADELLRDLVCHDIPAAPVVAPSDLHEVPQFAAREMWASDGELALPRFPVRLDGAHDAVGAPTLDDYRLNKDS
ncbi:CoA transferase [Tsuneonella suprasediminis]|uniref:CaiB/BaiF CoA transferase family protein n=1 Tax=Tsuneonella suprasediminis TaxID=2306996 RepID=UPI002F9389EF